MLTFSRTDVREDNGRRELLLVNPWRSTESAETTETDSWTAALRRALSDTEGAPLSVTKAFAG
jgi:hypothetical protein